jgi:hypothetical protein
MRGGRSRFGHLEVATTHRNGDKPGKKFRPRRRCRIVHVVDVGGAIDHGDHGDHYLQPAGGLQLAPEEKPDALFHEDKSGRCCLFLAVSWSLS